MKAKILPIMISLLLASLAGCSLLPAAKPVQTPTEMPASLPPSSYEPQPADEKLEVGQVSLDIENSSLLVMESYPVQISVILNGSLPDPCHQLRVVVLPANDQNQINLMVYSIYDPSEVCITVIQPFSATIPLGSYKDGHYTVYANGKLLGEFDA